MLFAARVCALPAARGMVVRARKQREKRVAFTVSGLRVYIEIIALYERHGRCASTIPLPHACHTFFCR